VKESYADERQHLLRDLSFSTDPENGSDNSEEKTVEAGWECPKIGGFEG
jgi:hypothetical protein